MQLGKASAYAVLGTVYLAEHSVAGPVQGRVVAEAYDIPPEYLLKILQQLVRSRVLRSEAGRRGGFMLRKPPDEITLLEIVEALDGPITGELSASADVSGGETPKSRLQTVCEAIADHTRQTLQNTSIKDLIEPQ